MLQENNTKGQRVEAFKVEAIIDNDWQTIAESTTIGYKKLLRIPETTTDKVRLTIMASRDHTIIANMGLFLAPEILSDPVITGNKQGEITITTETLHPVIRYTLDGSEPTASSIEYGGPFLLKNGGIVKARSFINNFKEESSVVTKQFFINKSKWKVIDKSDESPTFQASDAIDGNNATMWYTSWEGNIKEHPHSLTVDIGEELSINGFYYTPRVDENKSGTVFRYSFLISTDGKNWNQVIDHGEFSNIANNPVRLIVKFKKTAKARYFRFISHEGAYNEPWISAGEIGVTNIQ